MYIAIYTYIKNILCSYPCAWNRDFIRFKILCLKYFDCSTTSHSGCHITSWKVFIRNWLNWSTACQGGFCLLSYRRTSPLSPDPAATGYESDLVSHSDITRPPLEQIDAETRIRPNKTKHYLTKDRSSTGGTSDQVFTTVPPEPLRDRLVQEEGSDPTSKLN